MTDGVYLNRPISITTGIAAPQPQTARTQQQTTETSSFAEVLKRHQQNGDTAVSFSKHAQNRIADRGIELSDAKLERLSRGMRLAEEKGLDDTLILVDKTAFIVSVKNGTVVTTLGGDDLNGNVFTNIEGTVII